MALKDVFIECLNILKDIPGVRFRYLNIWNEQIKEMISGEGYSIPSPAAFVEIVTNEPSNLTQGIVSYTNCRIRIHIYHQILDGGSGKMEADYTVFDIARLISKKFNILKLNSCSPLQLIENNPDYDHGNEYMYTLGYMTNFIDLSGSIYDDINFGSIADYTLDLDEYYEPNDGGIFTDPNNNGYTKDLY